VKRFGPELLKLSLLLGGATLFATACSMNPSGESRVAQHAHISDDLAAQYSNATPAPGNWEYGRSNTRFSAFTRHTTNNLQTAGISRWYTAALGVLPGLFRNNTAAPIPYSSITFAPGQVALLPGAGGEYSVVRWTAPEAGTFHVNARFRRIDTYGAYTGIGVLRETGGTVTEIYASDLVPNVASQTFENDVTMTAGQQLRFFVSVGQNNSNVHDATELNVTITHVDTGGDGGVDGGTSYSLPDNAAEDYSNTTAAPGRWQYGRTPNLTGAFSLYNFRSQPRPGLSTWNSPSISAYPLLWHNDTASPIAVDYSTLPPGQIVLHPGFNGEYSALRWRAPATATYRVQATFNSTASGGYVTTSDAAVLTEPTGGGAATTNFAGTLSSTVTTLTFDRDVALTIDQQIRFSVGAGSNGGTGDGTEVRVTIGTDTCPVGSTGTTHCGATCVNTDTDPANCGGCGVTCAGPNGLGTCNAGVCACAAGFADCNGLSADGCEANLARDPQHCGTCATHCTPLQTCFNSVCGT